MGYLARFNFERLLSYGYDHFIETGTGKGYAIDHAIKAGFQRIDSVEQSPELFTFCKKKYQSRKNFGMKIPVNLNFGRSVDFLQRFDDFEMSVVFLDAHFANGADFKLADFDESAKHPDSFPAFRELNILLTKDIKNTVIIIDDARMWYKEITSSDTPLGDAGNHWHRREELEAILSKFVKHQFNLINLDHGYIVLMPPPLSYHVSINIQ